MARIPARPACLAVSLFVVSLLVAGCGGASTEPSSEQSVRPGANARFLSDELDVSEMEGIFEGESREISVEREAIANALGLAPGDSVADIGAGTGLFMPLFSKRVGDAGQVYAVDISPVFVAHLRDRTAREDLGNVDVVLGGERSTNLSAGSVDLAFVCDTYHHFEYPRAMLADLLAAIRPGGQLVVIDFERIPGVTPDWIIDHVRDGKEVFRAEIEAAGFTLIEEIELPGIEQNYVLRFARP